MGTNVVTGPGVEVAEGYATMTLTKSWRQLFEQERISPQEFSNAEIGAVVNAMSERSPEVIARLLLRWLKELEGGYP